LPPSRPRHGADDGWLRPLLCPVAANERRVVWTDRAVPLSLATGWYPALGEVARRRGFSDTAGQVDDDLPAVAGVRLGFTRGPALTGADFGGSGRRDY
jgi:hypothetical protein